MNTDFYRAVLVATLPAIKADSAGVGFKMENSGEKQWIIGNL